MAIQFDNSNAGVLTMAPAASGNYTLTWPSTAGTSNYFLQTNGSGVLTWAVAGGVPTNATLTGVIEQANNVASAPPSTVNLDVVTSSFWNYTTNTANNWTLNIRGNSGTTLSSLLAVGTAITVVLIVINGGTAFYQTTTQVDGATQTVKWQGGAAPAAGSVSANDIYTITVLKTAATPTYSVFGSQVKFA
jgi:hypothetical protein